MRLITGAAAAACLFAQAPDRSADLEAVREYALSYSERLPNYTATQALLRQTRPTQQGRFMTGTGPGKQTVEEQVSYVEGRELHKVVRVNGRPVKEWESETSGAMYSSGEFALLLKTIFRPETKAEFRFERTAKLGGAEMMVFAFSVPQLPNGYVIQEGSRGLIVPYTGLIFANAGTHAVMRIQMTCRDIPSVSQIRRVQLTLDYKGTKVAGQDFILPSRYTMHLGRNDADVTIEATFKDYQRFAADATIIFEEEPPQ